MSRKRVIILYEIAIIIPLVLVSLLSLLTGTPIIGTVPGLLGTLALMLACLCYVYFSVKRRTDDSMTKLVTKYDYECNPEALVKGGGQIAFNAMQAREKGDLLQVGDAWFLSPYALACLDTGATESAQEIASAIIEDAMKQKKFADQASMLVNVEPVVLRLRGPEEALSVLNKAEELASFDESDSMREVLSYIGFEKSVLEALCSNDQDKLLELFVSVMNNEKQPMRIRVLDADAVGSIYRARGREDFEIQALNFVELHGGTLPVKAEAEKRLEELFSVQGEKPQEEQATVSSDEDWDEEEEPSQTTE